MFLTRLRLENVRAHRRFDLDLTRNGHPRTWTFLLGENGVGKSTVVKSLALVLAGSDALGELLGDEDTWIRHGEERARIIADLITKAGKERHVELVLERGSNLRKTLKRNEESLSQLDDALANTTRNYAVFGYGVHRRINLGDRSGSGDWFQHPRANAVATLFARDAALVSLERWATDLDYRDPAGFTVVRETLEAFLPGVRLEGVDKSSSPPRLMFETPDGPLPLRELSDGYQSVAGWCGDLMHRIQQTFGDYKDPLSARGVLLIDEVALHLHPTWQRSLYAFLQDRLPNLQILVTTHSPLAVHAADAGEVTMLRRDAEGQVLSERYEGAPRELFLHQLLTSPLFGLHALDSPAMEAKRTRLTALEGQGTLTKSEAAEHARIRKELAEMPDYRARDPEASDPAERLDLLQQAVDALNKRAGR